MIVYFINVAFIGNKLIPFKYCKPNGEWSEFEMSFLFFDLLM